MQKIRIYADFNGIVDCRKKASNLVCLALTGYGTIASLSRHQICLREGLILIFYEPNDIEVEGEVFYDTNFPGKFTSPGQWLALYDPELIRNSEESSALELKEHLCFNCRLDLTEHLNIVGRQYKEVCPDCGTSIMYPLFPPENSFNVI